MTTVDVDDVLGWCESMKGALLEYPFGPEAAVFKVGGKMFALVSAGETPGYVTLKAVPEEGEALRMQHAFIREGYYMNKRHWITVDFAEDTPAQLVRGLLEDSYDLVVSKLPKRVRIELGIESP
ncbi:MAG: MmcQ/YjbR family DNA-binding protein [Actinomycetota bacterium]